MSAIAIAPEALSLLQTKLRPPQLRDLIDRPRLLTQLDAGMQHRLTLVCAPAGSGKTTLLGVWGRTLTARGISVAWLSLDAGDNDLAHFLRYLVAALHSAIPSLGGGVLALLQSPPLPSVEALLTPLINALVACPEPLVLTIDDYHVIESSLIHTALTFLLDHLPPQTRLVLASRTDPPLALTRLRARGELTELHMAELRFTPDEAADFLGRVMGLRLSADEVAQLDARTEGWVAGLQLAALSLRQEAGTAQLVRAFAGSNRFLMDYLGEEVLQRQSESVQTFLMQTAILDRLCAPLCSAVTGRDDAQGTLEYLERANLFVIALDEERHWYRYHHLFADFLRQRLQRVAGDSIRPLHLRAAAWYEQENLPREAINHALSGADFERAARLVERLARPLMWQWSEVTTLSAWLEQLPADIIRSRPRLYLDETWSRVWSGDVADIVSRLRETEQTLGAGETAATGVQPLEGQGDSSTLRGELDLLRSTLAYFGGQAAQTIALTQDALAFLPPDDGQSRSLALAELGLGHRMRHEMAEAIAAHMQGARVAEESGQLVLALACRGYLVRNHHLAGNLHEAELAYSRVLELAEQWRLAQSAIIGLALVYMGDVLRERNDLERAERLLLRGIDYTGQIGGHAEDHINGYLSLLRVLRARQDEEGARHLIAQVEQFSAGTSFARTVALEQARSALVQGNLTEASRILTSLGVEVGGDVELVGEELPTYLVVARLLRARGQIDESLRRLERLRALAEAGNCGSYVVEVLAMSALGHWARGVGSHALDTLSRALALAEPEGYVQTFVDEGPPMAALLHLARDNNIARAYVDMLLSAFGDAPTPPRRERTARGVTISSGHQPLVEPLSERELEVLRMVAAGLPTTAIASTLVIAPGTVKNHLKHIFGKLDAHSRLQAIQQARAAGLL